ncbi:helix-turn-helix transcriptional regulator (plasmid) [Vibrio cholerae]|jgi:hypothetical protein|uniref:helix-turn-helix transcriptional regulator n=1 Tax=Vibrio TaxID=662 RepID=UPI000813C1DE|nr:MULTISPECIES: helix-turn-helix transcriptional regulator [Vibrio]OCP81311.1 hypothetical protein AKH11_14595 [Vibrio parahaemolyticus]OCQ06455.1 hypothetical protein AKH09_13630 [Vibrio parahaemolyticus]QKU73192.1 helix-turn-helix transcriptional regulator [Vibrio cholerae]QKU77182.1 helix-turn-helix transcriptional regulator [Vibrio cholerae]
MSNLDNKKALAVSDQEIDRLDEMLKTIDSDISIAMSYVRRAQGLTFKALDKRFSGINSGTLKRYMQQSYHSMRPIHIVAAYSWVTMVPMTAFYYGFKLKEFYRGMDDNAVEALVCIGRLPTEQFNTFLTIVCNTLSEESRREFFAFRAAIESEYGVIENYSSLFPPTVLDINEFAIDYYRSVAVTVKRFREENNISIDTISRVLGLSRYQYEALEKPNKIMQFPVSIGFRVKLGFKLNTHVNFTSEMRQFPEFHKLRQVQHVRDLLIVEALRRLKLNERQSMTRILTSLSEIYK